MIKWPRRLFARFSGIATMCGLALCLVTVPASAQWMLAGNPGGEQVDAFAVIGNDLFAAGHISGAGAVFRSQDNGVTWANTNLPSTSTVWSLFASGTNLLAGTDNGGIYLSMDNGASWSATDAGIPGNSSIRTITAIGNSVFVGTYGQGVYRSNDNGTSWNWAGSGIPSLNAAPDTCVINVLMPMGSTLFAGIQGGVYRSTDNGTTWTESDSGLVSVLFGATYIPAVYSLAVVGTALFAGTDGFSIFRSTDSGATWYTDENGLNLWEPNTNVSAFAVSCTNLFAGIFEGGIFSSSNSDTNWISIGQGFGGDLFYSEIALCVNDGYLFAAPWGSDTSGVWRLALDQAMIVDAPIGDSIQGTLCDSTNFAFALQTVGGCTHPTLDSVYISGLGAGEYTIAPVMRAQGTLELDSASITVNPSLQGTRSFIVNARYTNDANQVFDTSFTVLLDVAPAPTLSVFLQPAQFTDTANGLVSIPIYALGTAPVAGGSLAIRIAMRTDLLTPESIIIPIAGATAEPPVIDSAGAWITQILPSNFVISTDTLLATVQCRAYVTDTNQTQISIASSTGENGPNSCLSILGTGNDTFALVPHCGDATLEQFLHIHSPFAIDGIVPNPAQNEITVTLSGAAQPAIEMYDALGREVLAQGTTPQPPPSLGGGANAGVRLDISNVPSGIYYLRLMSDGYVESRSVVVQK